MTKKKTVKKNVKKKVAKKIVTKKKTVKKPKLKLVAALPATPAIRKNYLMMVLDESSSMYNIRDQAISAFNEQVKTVKQSKGNLEVSVNLVKFSSETSDVFLNQKVEDVKDLDLNTYVPNGMTAMFDGVGRAIEFLKSQPDINDPDVTVLFLVISDGAENCSRKYNANSISELTREVQKTNRWTLTYAGANQDLTKVQQTLNISAGNTSAFQATINGMTANNALRKTSTGMLYSSYSTGQTSVNNFYDQNGNNLNQVAPLIQAVPDSNKSPKQ